MCGIAGVMVSTGKPSSDVLNKLTKSLQHRGPDGTSIHKIDHVGLVHTRLAIIDVEGGDQPLFDENGNCLIVNGEIYNYIELKKELRTESFKTHSDCEPILPLYRKHDLKFTHHLRGMYALALYNKKTKQLILARDPFGIKPLYYTTFDKGFAFASEPQALIRSGLSKRLLNEDKAIETLELRYSLDNQTPFVDIKRLLPGEVIVVENGRITDRFRQRALPPYEKMTTPTKSGLASLDQILDDSLLVHLRSDVPYGLFLSGGIDSSSLLALMKRHISEPIKTYTIGFPGTKLRDERLLAREIVKAVRTDHTEIEFSEQDFWSLLPQVMKALDDPTLDFATLPTYKMASIAKNDVKVILCGEGGDEILGGYGRYQKAKLPSLLGGRLFTGYGMLESQGLLRRENMGWKETFQKTLQQDIDPHYTRLQKAQAIDISFWLPNDLLTKLDRCLMAHGVEGRTPFLDLPLAKTVFNLPDRMKIHWRTRKWLLRKWLHKNLPVADPFSHKRGFTVPVCEWMDKRRDDLADLVSQQAGIQQLCYPEVVRKLYLSSNLRTQNARWNLLSFALWHQIHIVDFAPAEDVFVTLASH